MSTSPPPAGTTPPTPPAAPKKKEVVIVSHCTLFYWWPVWAVGFVLFIITAIGGELMVTVPSGTEAKREGATVLVEVKKNELSKMESREAFILPAGKPLHPAPEPGKAAKLPTQPHLWMTNSKNLGVFFCMVLLLVIAITNIPLRGLWSVIVIVFILSIVIIFAILEWWAKIFEVLNFLDIRINAAGYLVISCVLFVLWLIVMLLFDRQVYMVFTPGQLRVRQEIGDAESAYDTAGMTIQKQRSDLFRHWILGIGSGDLIVKTAGAHPQEFHMPNVLFIGRKVNEIEEMIRQKTVVAGPI